MQVFGHLSSKDLVALTRTIKLLRQTLLAPNATTIWKHARESIGAPECFEDFSEPQWAGLLFGGTQCQVDIVVLGT
jgi:hypothetical protein